MKVEYNVTMIGDSNNKAITDHMTQEDKIKLTTVTTYTTKELLEYSTTTNNKITKADHILIRMGTSDLRTNQKAEDIYDRIERATTNIANNTSTNITIITPPPIATSTPHKIERRLSTTARNTRP